MRPATTELELPSGTRRRRLTIALSAATGVLALFTALHVYVRASGVREELRARADQALAARLDRFQLGENLEVGLLGTVTLGPLRIGSPAGRDDPAILIEEVVIRPRLGALLRGRAEPASVLFRGVRVDAAQLRQAPQLFRSKAGRSSAGRPLQTSAFIDQVAFEDLFVQIPPKWLPAMGAVTAGPFHGAFTRSPRHAHDAWRLRLELPAGGVAELQVERANGKFQNLSAHLAGLAVAPLAKLFEDRLPLRIDRGVVSAELVAPEVHDLRRGAARLTVHLEEMVLSGERLAPKPVGPVGASVQATVSWSGPGLRVEVSPLVIRPAPESPIALQGALRLEAAQGGRFALDLSANKLEYEALVATLPEPLAPSQGSPRAVGTISGKLHLEGPVRAPEEWQVAAKLDLKDLKSPPVGGPLGSGFIHRAVDAAGRERQVRIGPDNPLFVRVAELPTYVFRAVTVSEDAGFFAHDGFDFEEIKNSLGEDSRLRGASTITQQLAKNLYLSRERTYARKVREALATIALEATLSKQRLLELYLNVIEWGPGIYGLGEAAAHYFGKPAAQLSPKEAAFLASIIPNPVRYHAYCSKGALTPLWEERVADVLRKLADTQILDHEEVAAALSETLVFRHPPAARKLERRSRRASLRASQQAFAQDSSPHP